MGSRKGRQNGVGKWYHMCKGLSKIRKLRNGRESAREHKGQGN